MTLIKNLHSSGRLSLLVMICLLATFNIALLVFRIRFTGSIQYVFLIWNLFLAFIPYITGLIINSTRRKWNLAALVGMVGFWLIFLPNAPYLMTDIAHLSIHNGIGMWYDLMLLIAFASTGLILTLMTLYDVHAYLRKHYSEVKVWGFMIAVVYGCGMGIYAGRFLRWNSWDLFTQPQTLLEQGAGHFFQAQQPALQIGFAFLLGSFIMILYFMAWYVLRVFARKEMVEESSESMRYIY